jgi:hypothetical protein
MYYLVKSRMDLKPQGEAFDHHISEKYYVWRQDMICCSNETPREASSFLVAYLKNMPSVQKNIANETSC